MFLLFFSLGTKAKDHGQLAARACPRCGNAAPWRRLEQYRYLSLFFVRILRWRREELAVCPICGHTEPLSRGHRPGVLTPAHA